MVMTSVVVRNCASARVEESTRQHWTTSWGGQLVVERQIAQCVAQRRDRCLANSESQTVTWPLMASVPTVRSLRAFALLVRAHWASCVVGTAHTSQSRTRVHTASLARQAVLIACHTRRKCSAAVECCVQRAGVDGKTAAMSAPRAFARVSQSRFHSHHPHQQTFRCLSRSKHRRPRRLAVVREEVRAHAVDTSKTRQKLAWCFATRRRRDTCIAVSE